MLEMPLIVLCSFPSARYLRLDGKTFAQLVNPSIEMGEYNVFAVLFPAFIIPYQPSCPFFTISRAIFQELCGELVRVPFVTVVCLC